MNAQTLIANVAEFVKTKLKPIVDDIDRKGYYPEAFMRELGAIGGFGAVGTEAEGGNGLGLATQIAVLREIGKECGATSFSAWCQAACAWYLHQTPNRAVKDKYLADILQGKVLAGTGMSNTVKHLADIEKHNLQAERVEGGYTVNGALPWVSNIGEDHIWANTAQIGGGYVMFITGGQWEGVSLQNCPEFCALEGTRTFSLNFKDVFIPDEDIIAAPEQFADYIQSIKAGFILLQIGIGAGVIDGSLGIIRLANVVNAEVNRYLDDGYDSLKTRLDGAWAETERLAGLAWSGTPDNLTTLKLREAAAVLTLAAAQSAALHSGAKGYLMRSPAQRRVREAMFVAIVTPAIKHLLTKLLLHFRPKRLQYLHKGRQMFGMFFLHKRHQELNQFQSRRQF
ncbi:acyl-CoA dehydrogenase, N-terminal domain protein [Neisseria meningitidis NM3042]|nr:acyl-CoA dehydrogenase, N-terminal domain protein [Neisseria meningitidis NM3042]